jgi:hypothetical protein
MRKFSLLPKSRKRNQCPANSTEARQWLAEVAEHLANYANGGPSYRFVAARIKKYLRRPDVLDLRRELGLLNPVGRPKNFVGSENGFERRTREIGLARRAHEYMQAGKNMHQASKKLQVPYRTLKRLYDKHLPTLRRERNQFEMDRYFRSILRSD